MLANHLWRRRSWVAYAASFTAVLLCLVHVFRADIWQGLQHARIRYNVLSSIDSVGVDTVVVNRCQSDYFLDSGFSLALAGKRDEFLAAYSENVACAGREFAIKSGSGRYLIVFPGDTIVRVVLEASKIPRSYVGYAKLGANRCFYADSVSYGGDLSRYGKSELTASVFFDSLSLVNWERMNCESGRWIWNVSGIGAGLMRVVYGDSEFVSRRYPYGRPGM